MGMRKKYPQEIFDTKLSFLIAECERLTARRGWDWSPTVISSLELASCDVSLSYNSV